MYVIPAKGRQVPDPFMGGNLPPEGREVEANQYWHRRVNDEDVTEGTPPKAETAEVIEKPAAKIKER